MSALAAALAVPGLGWVAAATLAAGLVRGFTGFGSALIFMPVAAAFLTPVWAIVVMLVMETVGPLPTMPRAIRSADLREVGWLVAGFMTALPFGIWALVVLAPDAIRWCVSGVGIVMLAVLLGGWRYTGPRGAGVTYGAGLAAGIVGGTTGLTGPPAILFYLASPLPAPVVRANMMIYLYATVVVLLSVFFLTGRLSGTALAIGALMTPLFLIGTVVGARLFRPGNERGFRAAAYAVIAGSAIVGLPVWG